MAEARAEVPPSPRPHTPRPAEAAGLAALARRWPHLSLADHASLISRVVLASLFLVLYVTGTLRATGGHANVIVPVGIGILVAAALLTTLALLVWQVNPRRVLRLALVPDLVSAILIIWGTGSYQDPLYPWMIGLAMIYGVGLSLRESMLYSSLVGASYFAGHLFGHMATQTGDDYVIVAFKALAIIITSALVGDVSRRQAQREMRLRQTQRQYHDLNERLSRRLGELRAVSEITDIIHSKLDFDEVGHLVLEIVSKIIDLPASALFVIDKRRDETLFSASFGVAPTLEPPTGQFSAVAAGEETFACTTVLDRDALMVVFCAPGERLETLDAEDRLVLASVANDLTIAVENSELYKLTKKLAITDELTGLYNYRYMLQRLDDEIERARRYGRSVSMLMLDADEFKLYNDTHGHIAGDTALMELGAVLHGSVRDIDVVCRYGGEEFAILLPETDAEGAFVAAEKVRDAVAAHAFPAADGARTEQLTVSIGLSTFPRRASDREELLRQADDALYVAKRSGRNRVNAATDTAVSPEGPASDATGSSDTASEVPS